MDDRANPMHALARGLSLECDALHALLAPLPDAAWDVPTQFNGWTFEDILSHLHFFDTLALLTLREPARFQTVFGQLVAAVRQGTPSLRFQRDWLGRPRGQALLAAWRQGSQALASAYAGAEARQRVQWAGPAMSARSALSARLMETWAHAQAIYDQRGVERVEGDHLYAIAHLGVNTYPWSFALRELDAPQPMPHVRLTAPSGAIWQWGPPSQSECIEGSAAEFCQVVTQTRHIADTQLRVAGENARAWMRIAQCFAGVPRDPPAPGTRFRTPRINPPMTQESPS